MKFRYIFTALVAAASLMVGCAEEELTLDEIKVSQSTVAIPVSGGKTTITLNATGDWKLGNIPEWLTVKPVSGKAGEATVEFSAEATADANSAELNLECEGAVQVIKVIQGVRSTAIVPIKDVLAGGDGKTYRVKGAVSSIAANVYGNYNVTDDTGTIYIYGTLDANGAEKNFGSWGLEAGDIITVQGPKTTYNGVIELVNVTVIEIEKSLIKVEETNPENGELPKEGGVFTVTLANKGDGVNVVVPEAAKSWLSISGVTTGTTTTVTFDVAANAAGERKAELVFKTSQKGKEYSATTTLVQKGSIIEVTIDKFAEAAVDETVYRLAGAVTNVADAAKGNFTIQDATGSTYVYKCSGASAVKAGDIVTLTGKRGEFKGDYQVVNGAIENVKPVTATTVADFLSKPESKDTYFQLTGKVRKPTDAEAANNCKFDLTDFGNFMLEDATGSVYVYGVVKGWGGKNAKGAGIFATLGVKEGDTITVTGVRTSYKGLNQLGSAFYVSHTTPAGE